MAYDFLPYNPDQIFLLPPSPQDWLPEDHLAYQVMDVVGELDLSAFLSAYGKDGRGAPGFSPVMMCALFLYAWIRKVYSSRKISALCRGDVGGRVIGAGYVPDYHTINNFRLRHQGALNDFFKQSVKLCDRAGMVDANASALDGSKIAANASKRKAMSYERMVLEEARLQAEIDGYFKRAAEEDAAEDAEHGPDNAGPTISNELKRRQSRIAKIREAKAELEAEAQAAADAKQKERAEKEARATEAGIKLSGRPPQINPEPKSTAQRSFTDPESRIMKGGNGSFLQAYNAQIVVNAKAQVITGCTLSQQAADVGHLPPMLDDVKANTGEFPEVLLADPGYFSEENMKAAAERGVTALIPPDRERHGTVDKPSKELSKEDLAALPAIEQMRHCVSTQAGRDAYRKRKGIVEPVFGQIKGSVGNPGMQGFLRRGWDKCNAEWTWTCAAHNIQKYIRFKLASQNREKCEKPTRNVVRNYKQVLFPPVQHELCL
jgi:transposase